VIFVFGEYSAERSRRGIASLARASADAANGVAISLNVKQRAERAGGKYQQQWGIKKAPAPGRTVTW